MILIRAKLQTSSPSVLECCHALEALDLLLPYCSYCFSKGGLKHYLGQLVSAGNSGWARVRDRSSLNCFSRMETVDKLPTTSKWVCLCREPVGWTANHLHLQSLMAEIMLGEFSKCFSLQRLINVFNFSLLTKCRFSFISQWHLDYEESHKNRAFEWSCKYILLVQQSSKDFSQVTPFPVGAYLRYCGKDFCSW